MNRILILLLVLLSSFGNSNSQEVLCNIRVVPKGDLPISDRQKLQTLQKSAKEFINNRKWTNEIFKDEERIEFNLSFNILEKVSTRLCHSEDLVFYLKKFLKKHHLPF